MNSLMVLLLSALLAGCAGLPAQRIENTHLYLLDAKPATADIHAKNHLMLAVSMPVSRPGFDTAKMAYQQMPLELEYFAAHRWADTPAHMLRPLIVQALAPHFDAVVQTSGMADLRLDTELIRLQQNFTSKPGKIQLALRAQLIDIKDRRVIAGKIFDETENTASEDAYGGVIAANRALARLLVQLAEFCNNAAYEK